jgi:hypothetical protein
VWCGAAWPMFMVPWTPPTLRLRPRLRHQPRRGQATRGEALDLRIAVGILVAGSVGERAPGRAASYLLGQASDPLATWVHGAFGVLVGRQSRRRQCRQATDSAGKGSTAPMGSAVNMVVMVSSYPLKSSGKRPFEGAEGASGHSPKAAGVATMALLAPI